MSDKISDRSPTSIANLRAPGRRTEEGNQGKGGNPPPLVSNREFLRVIFGALAGVFALVRGLAGNPKSGSWSPRDAADVDLECLPTTNNYYNCSTVRAASDGSLSAKKEHAATYHVLVLDDVGTKVPLEALPNVKPTYRIETSPGNHHLGFRLTTPVDEPELVEEAQRAVVAAGLSDAGATGMTRWMRLPNGINGKPEHQDENGSPFQCELVEWNPDVSYELEDLVRLLAPGAKQRGPAATIPHRHADERRDHGQINSEVYRPAAAESPVVTALKEHGLHKFNLGDGRHDITCPWCSEHTDQLDDGACFFEPTPGSPFGGFKCHHGHCANRKLKNVLEHLGLTRAEVRNLPRIRSVPGELPAMVEAAQLVMARTGEFFQLNGAIVRLRRDRVGKYALRAQTDTDLTMALAVHVDWEYFREKDGKWHRGNPNKETVRLLCQLSEFRHLPPLKAMVSQPVLDDDGKLHFEAGYDAGSGLYLAFDPGAYKLPEPTHENALTALAALTDLLSEFRFNSQRDFATALAAIFTAVLRRGLGRCPAFHVRAPAPGSGKSYLCEVIAYFADPRPPAKISYPTRDEEASKAILAVLIGAPAVLEFDDMADDWKSFGAVNRMLTSATFSDRLLGVTETATVSTDVLVLGSGNNTGPRDDLLRRVCVIELDTREETPVTIKYSGNPLSAVVANREAWIVHVLTIIRAWQAAGSPCEELPSLASYNGPWSTFCRQPLVWLGLPDPAQGLIEQLKSDESRPVLGNLLKAWHDRFRDRPVMVRQLREEMDGPLGQAIEDLPFMEGMPFNPTKCGYYLKRNANRPVNGLRLEKAKHAERNAWRVVALPPLPQLPPSSRSPAAEG
jgi:hypothetical protein